MIACATRALAALLAAPLAPAPPAADTLRLEVGSPAVNLSRMRPHEAKVVVEQLQNGEWRPVTEWTNRLEVGDSAGRPVHRWTTIGTRPLPGGGTATWHLYQTFDAATIAPLGLRRTSSDGNEAALVFDGPRVRGTRKAANGTVTPIEVTLSRAAYPAAASDLVPMGVALRDGLVMTVPVWQAGMPDAETRVFTVLGRRDLTVAGTRWNAWAVEERAQRAAGTVFIGTWYIVEEPPYMVYAEVEGPNGSRQRMTEVLVGSPK